MPTWAVVVSGHPVNNVLHAILAILCCGLWLPVWVLLAANGGERRTTIGVDEWGRVQQGQEGRPAPQPLSNRTIGILAVCGVVLLVLVLIARGGH